MLLTPETLPTLAHHLTAERKCQGLSRAQAAAVCNVSASFIRDAENHPSRCSVGLLLQYMNGLGLSAELMGWSHEARKPIDSADEARDPESKTQ